MTKVTLYGVDDDYRRGTPRIVSAQAEEHEKTYRLDRAKTERFLGYRVVIKKKSTLFSLTPEDALRKYIHRQAQVIKRGRQATTLKAEAEELLLSLE